MTHDPTAVLRRAPIRVLLGPAAALGGAAGTMILLVTVDPNQPGHYPACPFLWATGVYCPACGSLRALHALGQGRLGDAVDNNLLTVLAVPLLAWLWAGWTLRRWRGRPWSPPAHPLRLLVPLLGVLAFWVARNLPAGAALAP